MFIYYRKTLQLNLVCIMFVSSFTGCSLFQKKRGGTQQFQNSALSNQHPAPTFLSPPGNMDGPGSQSDVVIDDMYKKTQADYHYFQGESLSLDGQTEAAIEAFKATLIYDPESSVVRMRLAGEYVNIGLLSEALEQAKLAEAAAPENIDTLLFLGGIYSSLKMFEKARVEYQKILVLDPSYDNATIYIGALLAEQIKYKEAEAYLREALRRKGYTKAPEAYYYIGRIIMESQAPEEDSKAAEMAFMKALELRPDFEDVVLALSHVYRTKKQKNKRKKLLASYQKKFGPRQKIARILNKEYLEEGNYKKAQEELGYLEGFEPDNLNIKVKIALILIEQKLFAEAINKLESILALEPGADKILFYLGAVNEEIKENSLAIKYFSEIQPASNYYPEAILHKAFLQKSSGDIKGAVKTISKALKQSSNDVPEYYTFYASLLDQQKKHKEAIALLEKANKKHPKYVQIKFFLGSLYDQIGEREKTVVLMKEVLRIDESHVQSMNYLAYTYAELNDNLEEAEELASRALKFRPKDGYVLDTLGWVLFKRGKIKEAVQYLEAAHKTKSDESIIAEHLGDAYYKSDLVKKAKHMYSKAVSVEKDKKKIDELRRKIYAIDNQIQAKREREPASSDRPSSLKPGASKQNDKIKEKAGAL